MTGVTDICKEMIDALKQIDHLKSKVRKTAADFKELYILNEYYSNLYKEYSAKSC